jgi:Ca2+-binding RTX toxin-like protein
MSQALHRVAAGAGAALTLTVASLATGGLPAQAVAGSAYVSGSTLYFVGQPNENHNVMVKLGLDGRYHVVDWAALLVPSVTCPAVSGNELSCDATGVTSIVMIGANLADNLGVRGTLIATLYGGSGDDSLTAGDTGSRLIGGPGADLLIGGYGDDTLDGGPGNDRLLGGSGNDLLIGGEGADVMAGGDDLDTVSYADQSEPVTADADDAVGDDGAEGERDSITSDVEGLVGGPADDRLTGGSGDDTLVGGGGSDWLDGRAGFDLLFGDALTGVRGSAAAPGRGDRDICLLGDDGGLAHDCATVR